MTKSGWVSCSLLVIWGACDSDASAPRTVVMSGTAYGFNTPDPLVGAEIRIDEAPELVTTSAADGSWSLTVPADAETTPYITKTGYVTMHLETFAVAREPIARVNFQTVTNELFALLAQVIAVTPDPAKCQIASTVSEKVIQTMTFDEFKAHGAHGVADAIVTITPAASETIYFNAQTIPDRTLTATTRDGGVVWGNLPPGRYTLHAEHPTRQFADVTVACEAGRFVNANPPWGLREL